MTLEEKIVGRFSLGCKAYTDSNFSTLFFQAYPPSTCGFGGLTKQDILHFGGFHDF
jgi:hypothetical protein